MDIADMGVFQGPHLLILISWMICENYSIKKLGDTLASVNRKDM